MRRIIILGGGVSGQAAKRHFESQGEKPIVLENDASFDFRDSDLVVKSPGIRPDHPWMLAAKNVIEEAELGLQQLKGKVLGVTGSNGKTTTTLLVSHVTGAQACGNVGTPICGAPEADLYVVELSSFQLFGMKGGPYLDAAVILNITPNHLDWHASFEEYRRSKFKIVDCLKEGAPFWCNLFPEMVETILGVGYRECGAAAHELQNMAAAWLLCQSVGVTREQFWEGIATFKKPPHRMERVLTKEGVDFINDSKATSIDAVKAALSSLGKPVHLIAGGVDKGGSFEELQQMGALRSVFALGEARGRIEKELQAVCPVTLVADLEEAIRKATRVAKSGECVLLSPGCSSYDQFRDFEERGERFREIVLSEGKR